VRTIDAVPRLRRPDGAEIEWWMQGQNGPLVAIALMAFHPANACQAIAEELARDHRVLRYDLRGTGASSRTGPYDALVVALGDGARRAVRAAAGRPDLIHTVAISGELPLGRIGGGGSHEALANSPAVLDALLGLMESDYRTGLRTMLSSGGEWNEEALRARLDAVEAHSPADVGLPRLRSWIEDDSRAQGRALGSRLWYLHYPGNPWFQGSIEIIRRSLPEARLVGLTQGVISSPAENAATIRQILAGRAAAA
jgi:pimeloyl-ACP methyl ester carboxylesterase